MVSRRLRRPPAKPNDVGLHDPIPPAICGMQNQSLCSHRPAVIRVNKTGRAQFNVRYHRQTPNGILLHGMKPPRPLPATGRVRWITKRLLQEDKPQYGGQKHRHAANATYQSPALQRRFARFAATLLSRRRGVFCSRGFARVRHLLCYLHKYFLACAVIVQRGALFAQAWNNLARAKRSSTGRCGMAIIEIYCERHGEPVPSNLDLLISSGPKLHLIQFFLLHFA